MTKIIPKVKSRIIKKKEKKKMKNLKNRKLN